MTRHCEIVSFIVALCIMGNQPPTCLKSKKNMFAMFSPRLKASCNYADDAASEEGTRVTFFFQIHEVICQLTCSVFGKPSFFFSH